MKIKIKGINEIYVPFALAGLFLRNMDQNYRWETGDTPAWFIPVNIYAERKDGFILHVNHKEMTLSMTPVKATEVPKDTVEAISLLMEAHLIGFRSESFYGEGYRDIVEVMAHEIFELGNTDILDTLSETILKDTHEGRDCEILSSEMGNGCVYEHLDADHKLWNLWENSEDDIESTYPFIRGLVDMINKVTGKTLRNVLWLCDKPDDLSEYILEGVDVNKLNVDVYPVSEVIISDIGSSGKLYAYESTPQMFMLR